MPRAKRPNPAFNRTDLNTPQGPTKIATAPGQAYGQQTAQRQSQRVVPIGTPPVPAPTAQPGGGAGSRQQPTSPAPLTAPGEIPWLGTPGSGGVATAGLPNSSGPGPESLTGMGAQWWANKQSEQGSLQAVMAHLASQPGASSVIKGLAATAGVGRG